MIPGWKAWIQEALADSKSDRSAGYYALATLCGGVPHVRHVVHRGFLRDSTTLVTTTDVRAPKVEEIRAQSAVELAWWIAPAKVQFRISGTASVLPHAAHVWRGTEPRDLDAERERVWHALGPGLQNTFRGAPPGISLADASHAKPPEVDASSIPTSFALLLIEPHKVDVLDLTQMKRTVYERIKEEQWSETEVTP
ncbi:tRNA-dihydrouridine(20) synthase [NAD(P)(+)] [Malassezia brasiliensis]|uniref:tRNA-dihydrouridine(20) synthase [NAD(P)(+)] n=1 Tax=Malassezia brasiliensis TaxID=1821822 RepID=A0AAF0DVG2_9BASI|nr:tRNA-dihydrouridine(20) synthase [NAD(P)(+)] [Malassezia brasiliensis]